MTLEFYGRGLPAERILWGFNAGVGRGEGNGWNIYPCGMMSFSHQPRMITGNFLKLDFHNFF